MSVPEVPAKHVELFVKAGADGVRYGACPFCQRIFMILLLKSQKGNVTFTVNSVNLAKPSDDFREAGLRHVPALKHATCAFDNLDEIVQYLDEHFTAIDLSHDNVLADRAVKDIFSRFCFFIREVSKDPFNLINELKKLNSFLVQQLKKGRYLCSDSMTHLDCEILPKLQHIRVAAKALKKFDIPSDLSALWQYLGNAYTDPVFIKSCPSDQEIIIHWADKQETPNLTMEQHAQLTNEVPHYSFDIPSDVPL